MEADPMRSRPLLAALLLPLLVLTCLTLPSADAAESGVADVGAFDDLRPNVEKVVDAMASPSLDLLTADAERAEATADREVATGFAASFFLRDRSPQVVFVNDGGFRSSRSFRSSSSFRFQSSRDRFDDRRFDRRFDDRRFCD
jgi:hypothetical protein